MLQLRDVTKILKPYHHLLTTLVLTEVARASETTGNCSPQVADETLGAREDVLRRPEAFLCFFFGRPWDIGG